MSGKGKKISKKQKKQLFKIFLTTVAITLVGLGVLIGILAATYNTFIKVDTPIIPGIENLVGNKDGEEDGEDKEEDSFVKNVAVFGVDEDGYRTDVIFVVNFNSLTNEVNIVSVPRDTRVVWTEQQKANLQALGKSTRSVSKINEMTSYGGIKNIRNFTVNQLENMFGISIDNYVVVSLDTFKNIVDAVGGVEMYVPQNMYYIDNSGGVYINLKEGQQVLDGERAEQLIRFRSYPEGDVARVRTQQLFIEAFIDTVLSPSMIFKIPELVGVLFDSVQTDVSLTEIPMYYPYVQRFDSNNVEMHLLPGVGAQDAYGTSYFYPDMDEMDEFIQVAFHNKPTQEELEEQQQLEDAQTEEESEATELPINKEDISIQILNGSGINGAASREQMRLEAEGYSVSEIGNYTQNNLEQTIIYTKDFSYTKQLEQYYTDVEIQEKQNLAYDVQVILGSRHEN